MSVCRLWFTSVKPDVLSFWTPGSTAPSVGPLCYNPPHALEVAESARGLDRWMIGRITRLIDDQQLGTIAGEDGIDYVFYSLSLLGATFGVLHVGASVTFTPMKGTATPRAEGVRVSSR